MKKENNISPSELKILEVLWEKSPLSSSQIVDKLEKTESWHSRTIKTLITRLVKKKFVGYEQENNRYFYFALLAKNDYQQRTSLHFIHRIFGGKISPLVAHFAQQKKLSKEDINEIKAILKGLDDHD